MGSGAHVGSGEQVTTICMICHAVKSGTGQPISHGLCYPCRELIYGVPSVPALMPPKANRLDCFRCSFRDLDSDGVPDGCKASSHCQHPDRRDPWGDDRYGKLGRTI